MLAIRSKSFQLDKLLFLFLRIETASPTQRGEKEILAINYKINKTEVKYLL